MWDRSRLASPLRASAWRLAATWAGVIFVLSSIPGSAFPEVPGRFTDKLVHIVLYGALGVLVARALEATSSFGVGRRVLLAGVLATAYGITDELHQLLTPRRSCDFYDVVADAVGGLLGGFLAATISSRRSPRDARRGSSKDSPNQP